MEHIMKKWIKKSVIILSCSAVVVKTVTCVCSCTFNVAEFMTNLIIKVSAEWKKSRI